MPHCLVSHTLSWHPKNFGPLREGAHRTNTAHRQIDKDSYCSIIWIPIKFVVVVKYCQACHLLLISLSLPTAWNFEAGEKEEDGEEDMQTNRQTDKLVKYVMFSWVLHLSVLCPSEKSYFTHGPGSHGAQGAQTSKIPKSENQSQLFGPKAPWGPWFLVLFIIFLIILMKNWYKILAIA